MHFFESSSTLAINVDGTTKAGTKIYGVCFVNQDADWFTLQGKWSLGSSAEAEAEVTIKYIISIYFKIAIVA
jgi:hypothetical protein